MQYLIVVFKSRTQLMRFYELLRSRRIQCAVINTPREASLGCGLSVKFLPADYSQVTYLLQSASLHSYAGMFLVTENGRSKTIRPY